VVPLFSDVEPVVTAAPPAPEAPAVPAEILEAEIEAAHPEHAVEGPAEPLSAVPALGEMPVETQEPDAAAVAEDPAAEPEPPEAPAEPLQPTPVQAAAIEPVIIAPDVPEPPRPRPSGPATSPGAAFKPDPVPAED
jgi:hypothetical protein